MKKFIITSDGSEPETEEMLERLSEAIKIARQAEVHASDLRSDLKALEDEYSDLLVPEIASAVIEQSRARIAFDLHWLQTMQNETRRALDGERDPLTLIIPPWEDRELELPV
ncbi:MAG: hypothetical protein CL911_05000 [Deltaproteobacteria bacterium]|nr:hypothetical protein [Deltaproteobacteria bacterium]